MIKYEHLVESLNSSYTAHVSESTNQHHAFAFLDEKFNMFSVDFMRSPDYGYLSIAFSMKQDGKHILEPTGVAANPLKVYSTIGMQLKKYIAEYPVNRIVFSAAHERTIPVYGRLAKKIATMMGGRVIQKDDLFVVHIPGER